MAKTSVALCTYNGEKFLVQQLESILNQSIPVDEIVVCDDGSQDGTMNILTAYQEQFPKIFKIYQNEKNLKSVKNFEKAISLCSNDIIFLSDQDDAWLDIKVETIVDFFSQNPNICAVATNGFGIDEAGTLLDKFAIWDAIGLIRKQKISFSFFKVINRINIATGASMAFRRKLVPEILPFPIIDGFHHDEWIALYSSHKNEFDFIDEKLFYYREHKSQQVGGVFLDKNERNKKFLETCFDFRLIDKNFKTLKRQLKILSNAREKGIKFINHVHYEPHKKLVEEDLHNIAEEFLQTEKLMREKYFIRTWLLRNFDKITGKRKF